MVLTLNVTSAKTVLGLNLLIDPPSDEINTLETLAEEHVD